MDANEKPEKVKNKKLVLLLPCALIIAVAVCLIFVIVNRTSVKSRLKGQVLTYTVQNAERSQATMLYFENGKTCQVHTYYYLDDLHLQQSFPYTVTKGVVQIDGQSYQASISRNSISLTDGEGNLYTNSASQPIEEQIVSFCSDVQSEYGKKLIKENAENEEWQKQMEAEKAEREKKEQEAEKAKREAQLEANKDRAWDIIEKAPLWSSYTIKDMLGYIFDPFPTITCEPDGDSVTRFVFTISGSYYINKAQLPSQKADGTMVVEYDVETGQWKIPKGKEIYEAMNLYYLLGLDGATKEALRGLYGY